jgi:FAD synthetase
MLPKPRNKKNRILVFGTFDILHPGHENFFRQARKLVNHPFLIVSIARDANVKKIKGKKPIHSEKLRLQKVKQHPLVDKAVLGELKDYIGHIIELKPDLLALGYDQTAYTEGLADKLFVKGNKVPIVRLKAFKPKRYKTSLLIGKKTWGAIRKKPHFLV